jgi:hypothetical protein
LTRCGRFAHTYASFRMYNGGMKKPMQFRLDPELIGRVDAARGADSRTAFLEFALERLLEAHVAPSREPVPSKPKPRKSSEVERVRSEVARVGGAGGRGAHLPTCRCGLCLAGRREGS